MKTTTLICSFLLLASCGGTKPSADNSKRPDKNPSPLRIQGPGENSPILISDGSAKFNQGHAFRITAKSKVEVRLAAATLKDLGYGCDPDTPNDCSGACVQGAITDKCKVTLTGHQWKLTFSDNKGDVASLSGKNTSDKFDIDLFSANLKIKPGASGSGVEVIVPKRHLKTGKLSLDGSPGTFDFDCGNYAKNKCMTIGYHCASACDPDDDQD